MLNHVKSLIPVDPPKIAEINFSFSFVFSV